MEQKKRKQPRRMDGRKKLLVILDAVLVVGLLAAVVVLAVTRLSGGKGGASVLAQAHPDSGQSAAAGEAQPGGDAVPNVDAAAAAANAETPYAHALDLADDGHPASVDFSTLTAEGVPAVAWLYSSGTAINYPVVQTLDNEYYMARNEQGDRDKNGAIFLDCRNTPELADAQVMIYGNPMENGSMFGSLVGYRDQSYFAEHPALYLYTADKSYRIDVFAAHTASPAMSNYPTWFENDSARATYLNEVRGLSLIQSDLTVAADARLVALVTASDFDAGENARFVVHGVLTEV